MYGIYVCVSMCVIYVCVCVLIHGYVVVLMYAGNLPIVLM